MHVVALQVKSQREAYVPTRALLRMKEFAFANHTKLQCCYQEDQANQFAPTLLHNPANQAVQAQLGALVELVVEGVAVVVVVGQEAQVQPVAMVVMRQQMLVAGVECNLSQ